ncbi:g6810 [Coccomyxa elongata]
MLSAINNIKFNHGHWKRGASDLDLFEKKDILIIRDNGTGISSTFFAEEASSLGHTRDYTKKHLINKTGLGRQVVSYYPPADQRHMTRSSNFVYDPRDEEWGYSARGQLIAKTDTTANTKTIAKTKTRDLNKTVVLGIDMMLEGEDSTFKSLAALLELFSEFGEGTGTMFVIAAPCSEPQQSLVPAIVNGKPDLLQEQDDPGNGGLREALWNEQNPGKAFEDLAIKFYVQHQEVDLIANSIVAAKEASGVVSPVIPILHPKGTLGWLLLAYQDKKLTARFELANDKRSGLHMAISCRVLNPRPSFFSKADSQGEYFDRKNAYAHLEEMVSMDEALLEDVPVDMHPKMPFTKVDAMDWKSRGGARNYYWTLGGAGVTGVFVANEELFTVNIDKDDLKESRLVAFLHAKLM